MRTLAGLIILSPLLALGLGCDKRGGTEQGGTDFESRLKEAKAIGDIGKRDAALTKVAEDAAAAGNVDYANKAVNGMTVLELRDAACRTCALKLASLGKLDDAKAMTNKINSLNLRDDTLADIAKGNPSK